MTEMKGETLAAAKKKASRMDEREARPSIGPSPALSTEGSEDDIKDEFSLNRKSRCSAGWRFACGS
jgi:hypothetical protein